MDAKICIMKTEVKIIFVFLEILSPQRFTLCHPEGATLMNQSDGLCLQSVLWDLMNLTIAIGHDVRLAFWNSRQI
jgi:hypothetical protein